MNRSSRHRLQLNLCRAIAILLIPIILISNLTYGERSFQKSFDPVPIIRVLQDVISAIIYENYEDVEKIINIAMSIDLPKEIKYIHTKLYSEISDFVELMKSINEVTKSNEVSSTKLKVLIYRLYRLRLDLKNHLTEYLNTLSKYFKDQVVGHVVREEVKISISMFLLSIDELIDELTMLYTFGAINVVPLNITITLPQSVKAGDVFDIEIYVEAPSIIKSVNSTIHITYGNVYDVSIHRDLPVNKEINISLRTPTIEDLLKSASIVMNEISIEVKVKVVTVIHNTSYIGTKIARSKLVFEEPLCEFNIPKHIYPNQPLEISVLAHIDYSLNTTIYIDEPTSKNLILSTLLKPGNNTFELTIPNLSTGYHKLIFNIEPKGYYLGTSYSIAFEVVRESLVALIKIPRIIIGPPFTLPIGVDVNSTTPHIIEVFVDGNELIKEKFLNESGIELEASIPITLFVWRYSVVVSINSLDPHYGSREFSTDIYVINTPLLIIALALLSFAMITSATSRYIFAPMQLLIRYLRRTSISERYRVRKLSIEIIARTRILLRSSRLINLYRRFLRIIAPYVGIPHEHETLREFYRRISMKIISFRELIYRFIKLYELDLYSKHDVDVKEAEEIVKRLEKFENE